MHATRTMHHLAASVALAVLFALTVHAQSGPAVPAPAADSPGVLAQILSPDNIAPTAFLLANVADAKTDWRFTGPISGKEYRITPAQRLSMAGGGLFTALAIRHYFPRTGKAINIGLTLATCYFAGRAYANTFNHSPTPAMPTRAPAVGFAVRLPLR